MTTAGTAHHTTRDWLDSERARLDMMAQAVITLAPRPQPDESTMSRRARKALARARKITHHGSK